MTLTLSTTEQLTADEYADLEKCEAVIERGLQTFVEVGRALRHIRDLRLYRTAAKTFEEYWAQRFPELSQARVYQYIDGSEVIDNLESSTIGGTLPQNERQVRPLTELEPEAQRLAWEVVKETAPQGKVTARHVKSVVSVLKDVLKTRSIDAGEGLDIPVEHATSSHLKAAITEETYERMMRQETHIAERQKHRADLVERASQASLPTGKYRVIYADPPWSYGNNLPGESTEPRDHYPTMPLEEICELNVRSMRAENAVLFLWATSPLLPEAFEVIRAWGFTYKTSFVWDKVAHNVGHYNSVRHELLLVATHGACSPDVPTLFDSVVSEERTEHSRKPETFRQIIDAIYPYGDRIELFARRQVEGWKAYGNEVP